jgi:outer membrane protein assembly factor BamB
MSRRNQGLILVLTIWGLAAAFPRPGEAKHSAELHTAIAASLPASEPKQFVIAAKVRQEPEKTKELQFPLQSLPKDVTLSSCAVRLVMAERYPTEIGNEGKFDPVVLSLFKSPLKGPESQPVAAWSVPPRTEARTAIILRSRTLCAALTPGQAEPARFVLQTSVREGRIVLFGQSDPSEAPRLLLTYSLPDAVPGEADWSQIRRDAQHSGRSHWRMYDPGGNYTPTQVAVVPLDGAKDRGDLRQSPLLYGSRIFNALDASGLNRYQLVARDRSGQVLSDVTVDGGKSRLDANQQPIPMPKFLVAGGRDRLYFFDENWIFGYSLASGSLLPAPEPPLATTNETLLPTSTPTVGADGSLYVAFDKYVRAYSPGPEQKLLWRYEYPNREGQVGAVTLSKDETTAYILLGGTDTRLVALDSATGDCRWQQKAADFAISRKVNDTGSMPIPVIAGSVIEGNDILVTSGFPTGDKLYVFHDEAAKTPAGGELVGPAPAPPACRKDKAPGGMEVRGTQDHILAPVAGPGDEAYYIRAGKLCRSLKKEETCADLKCEGAAADGTDITQLIGDSSAGQSLTHLYGLAAEKKLLFFITVGVWPEAVKCNVYPGGNLGPNLIVAPGGTLYNVGDDNSLQAIVPTKLADAETKPTLPLTAKLLSDNPNSVFRVSGKIQTADGLTLGADTDIILVAGESISFGTGFTVKPGAQLRARVGLGN